MTSIDQSILTLILLAPLAGAALVVFLPDRFKLPNWIALLTTLVTFIIGRAIYDILVVNFAAQVQMSSMSSDLWDFIGGGTILGLSYPLVNGFLPSLHHPQQRPVKEPGQRGQQNQEVENLEEER